MASPQEQLPPGWEAQWDANAQQYLFIETATGRSQWEFPQQGPAAPIDGFAQQAPAATGSSKRRAYAAAQSYYNASEVGGGVGGGGGGGYGGEPSGGYGAAAPQLPPSEGGGQFYTPGLDQQYGAGQQPPSYGYDQAAPSDGYANGGGGYGQPAPGYQQPGYGQPAPGMDHLAGQFQQMGFGGAKMVQLNTANLLTLVPEPRDLHNPPPAIILPPNAATSPSPHANSDYTYQRSTMNAIPTTSSLLNKTKIPLGLVITPYRSVKDGEPPVPIQADTVIARCRRCKTYINPYVQFIDGGSRWRCCMCQMSNEVPQLFDWDQSRNQPGDRWSRPELNYGTVEFIAPAEYMVRPPQPPVYIYLLDVSHAAVQSGMLATATRTILESLDRVPNEDQRTKVSLIAFDTSVYFFSLPTGTTEASMLVVSDVDDIFIPQPTDILVNLTEARASLEALLGRINEMFADSQIIGNALGPALQAAFKLCSSIGGKVIACCASLPTVGEGALKNREDPKLLGTPKESGLLRDQTPFYKTFAIECSKAHVSVDLFLFSSTYQDVATLACLPHYTSGQTFFYPAFNASRSEDALKFAHEFGEILAMPIMLEALMRVRATKGLRMASFHGNFFVRSTDLLTMPAVPHDNSYAIEVQIEETLSTPFVVFQTAILHTTVTGERRVRVCTTALPTTSNISDVYASVDQVGLATLMANKVVERSVSSKLEDAREALTTKMGEILIAYKTNMTAAGAAASSQLAIPENMKMFPLLMLGLLKNVGIRQSAQIPPDLRAYAQALLTSLPSEMLVPYIYPTFYSLHNMPPEAGTIGEEGVILPPPLPPTSERLERHGLFLIEDGQTIFLWVGRDAVPQLVIDVFNLPSYEALRGGKTTLPLLENPFSQRVNAIVAKIREMRRSIYLPHLYIVKEDGEPALRLWALSCLVHDRADILPSYQQFLSSMKEKVNGASSSY